MYSNTASFTDTSLSRKAEFSLQTTFVSERKGYQHIIISRLSLAAESITSTNTKKRRETEGKQKGKEQNITPTSKYVLLKAFVSTERWPGKDTEETTSQAGKNSVWKQGSG